MKRPTISLGALIAACLVAGALITDWAIHYTTAGLSWNRAGSWYGSTALLSYAAVPAVLVLAFRFATRER